MFHDIVRVVLWSGLFLGGIIPAQDRGTARDRSSDSQPTSSPLYRVKSDGKIGFIDSSGNLIISHRLEYAADFHEGLAFVRVGEKCGYIDTSGSLTFSDDRLCSRIHFDYSEGLAGFEYKTNRRGKSYLRHRQRGYLDRDGHVVIPPRFFNAGDFHDGLALVNEKLNAKFGFIDKTGNYVIPPKFYSASDFSEGLAAVGDGQYVGYIDTKGHLVIPMQFQTSTGGFFQEGLALMSSGDDRLGAIDRNGRFVVPPQHATAWPASEGLIGFSGGAARLRYYDLAGKVVIEADYDEFRPFSEGVAAVSINYKWGYIDRKGELVIPPKFDSAFDFKGGLALTSIDQDWVYIDRTGKVVWRGAYYY